MSLISSPHFHYCISRILNSNKALHFAMHTHFPTRVTSQELKHSKQFPVSSFLNVPLKESHFILISSFNLKVIFSFSSYDRFWRRNNRAFSDAKTIRKQCSSSIVGKYPPPQSRKWPARFPGPIGVGFKLCLPFWGQTFVCLFVRCSSFGSKGEGIA